MHQKTPQQPPPPAKQAAPGAAWVPRDRNNPHHPLHVIWVRTPISPGVRPDHRKGFCCNGFRGRTLKTGKCFCLQFLMLQNKFFIFIFGAPNFKLVFTILGLQFLKGKNIFEASIFNIDYQRLKVGIKNEKFETQT